MKKSIFGACFFMTFLTSLIAGAKEPVKFERVVRLPDAELRFSMTEDFSKDMPAAPLVEKVTIDRLQDLKAPQDRFVIGRRWWDLKPPGFFKKNWGSVQMTVAIGASIDLHGEKLDFCKSSQTDFLIFYRGSLLDKWRAHNATVAPEDKLKYSVDISPFFDSVGQRFVSYFEYKKNSHQVVVLEGVGGRDADIYSYYSVPIDKNFFIEFEFVRAPDLNGSPYLFQAQVRERIRSIIDSVVLSPLSKRGCVFSVIDKWGNATSVDLMKPDPSVLPKPIPVDEFLKKNGLKELPDRKSVV